MQTKHTPGPWLVMGNQRNGHFDFVLPMAKDEYFQANCKLIAAAPELLEALELMVQAWEGMPINGLGQPGTAATAIDDLAREAIAKAKGK